MRRIPDWIVWKVALIGAVSFTYFWSYPSTANSYNALILLVGALLGRLAFAIFSSEMLQKRYIRSVIVVLILMLLLGSLPVGASGTTEFSYGNETRWSGVWNNPNLYGLLMGVSFVLTIGILLRGTVIHRAALSIQIRYLWFVVSFVVCGIGLLKSYSRGAWVATVVAVGYLVFQTSKIQINSGSARGGLIRSNHWAWRNRKALAIIGISVVVLAFWQFRFTQWPPARRIFSISNINDFSWRNRVAAWKGATRMMVDRPWFGYGWGQAVDVYQRKYCPPQLENGFAIQMNDYFILGISAGVPALICFVVYIALSLRDRSCSVFSVPRSYGGAQDTQHALNEVPLGESLDFGLRSQDRTKAFCRAGAVVLLVGFWFDGGLFKPATGSVFWILLELGRQEPRIETNTYEVAQTQKRYVTKEMGENKGDLPNRKSLPWLRRVAWGMVLLAVLETVVLVGVPFLPVSKSSLRIARDWLIAPRAVADLDFVCAHTSLRNVKLGVLLQHASLANYNRQLVNWSMDDEIYRHYVVMPTVNPEYDGRLSWRRALWEYFYPKVRKESNPGAAAEIVTKLLRERVTIISTVPSTIEKMWGQKKADAKGLEALEVAALRSVGIPAQLNENGTAELFVNGKWQTSR